MIRKLRFHYSKRALRDLAGIYNYLLEKDPAAAMHMVAAIENKIVSLASSGNTGVSREWLSPGLRAFPFKDRCIYFRVDAGDMQIIRILHGRQEVNSKLFAPGAKD